MTSCPCRMGGGASHGISVGHRHALRAQRTVLDLISPSLRYRGGGEEGEEEEQLTSCPCRMGGGASHGISVGHRHALRAQRTVLDLISPSLRYRGEGGGRRRVRRRSS